MKKVLFTIAAIALMASNAMAFSLDGYQGPVRFKYSNWETGPNGAINGTNQELRGVGLVSTIEADVSGAVKTLWSAANSTEELSIVFGGYFSTLATSTQVGFSGGYMNVYLDNTKDFNPLYGTNGANAFATASDGILFLSTIGAIDPANGYTLFSNLFPTASGFSGQGNGYLTITGGSFQNSMGINTFGPGLDLKVRSTLDAPDLTGNGWPISSEDPVRGNVVPEPGTLALLGLGLMGMAVYGKRRMNS